MADTINAAELARQLNVPGLALRNILRAKTQLVPGHRHGEHYALTPELVAAIKADPDVQALVRRRRS